MIVYLMQRTKTGKIGYVKHKRVPVFSHHLCIQIVSIFSKIENDKIISQMLGIVTRRQNMIEVAIFGEFYYEDSMDHMKNMGLCLYI